MDVHDRERSKFSDAQRVREFAAIERLGAYMERSIGRDDGVLSVRVRAPEHMEDEYLLVLRRVSGDGSPEVAFHGAATLVGALVGASNRLANGTLKWHPDKYRNGGAV